MVAIPQTPIVNAGLRYMTGLDLRWVDDTHIDILEGQCRDSLNINDISLGTYVFNEETVGATIDTAVIGANGLDRSPLIANGRYSVFVIGDSTGYRPAAGLLSPSTNDPIIPDGYDMFRRIGYVATESSLIRKFYQYGEGMTRWYYFDEPLTILTDGNDAVFTEIEIHSLTGIPPQSTEVYLGVDYTPDTATNVAEFLPFGSTAVDGMVKFGCGVAAEQQGTIIVPAVGVSGVTKFLYKVGGVDDALTLTLVGYKDYLYPPQ